ncbi:hypothetical protein [Alteromonas ponticola]|uniref:Solute-binding protein family 3/N-terminal domain-containing protein n=1 Tax=Alteromonas ponticola TaxID=2720613 RepID=A0ABX1R496_9ALTE|nr:hypothetical protein [Alteromonas ponticola]NMH61262.1 hypothetical protein [Alteromonas ponticola]
MIRFYFSLLLLVSAYVDAKHITINVGTYQDHQAAIKQATTNDKCPTLSEVDLGENQVLTEYLIFCNALKYSDNTYEILLSSYPNNGRMLNDVQDKLIDATAIGIWRNEVEIDKLAISPALFRSNEFEKGLYSTKEVLDHISQFQALKSAVTLVNQNWYHDWEILECAGIKLMHVGFYEQMFNMIKIGRGQFVPITFGPETNLERNQFGISLYPFPNYKMVFRDSTHFVINTENKIGEILLADLQSGLRKLRDKGAIVDAYHRIGIINSAVKDWQPIQCVTSVATF